MMEPEMDKNKDRRTNNMCKQAFKIRIINCNVYLYKKLT